MVGDMELELKHLAAYLHLRINPLQIMYNGAIYTLDGLSGAWNVDLRQAMRVTENVHVNSVKPLLMPLSELKEHFDNYRAQIYSDFDYYISEIRIGQMDYNEYEYLFANHFDVFGLIDKGLAINKALNGK